MRHKAVRMLNSFGTMKKLKVYLADDHTLFRKAMMSMIQSFTRVGSVKDAENGKELLTLMKHETPDVVVVDLQMPVMDGVETCEKIVEKFPDVKIVVLTMHDSERYVLHMIEIGAHAFLLKNTEPDELEKAIYSVYDNDFYHNTFVVSILRKRVQNKLASHRPGFEKIELSDREKEIVRLTCRELTIHEIAERLNVSDHTVRNHRASVMEKAGVHTLVGLVKFAYESGLMT